MLKEALEKSPLTLNAAGILVAFDLDDTLYKERRYVESGYDHVVEMVAAVTATDASRLRALCDEESGDGHFFDRLYRLCDGRVTVQQMVEEYRNHFPRIHLPLASRMTLDELKDAGVTLALITDGRHIGQWNKIEALGLTDYFDSRLVSVSADVGGDKTSSIPWERMESLTPQCTSRWYIGDNPRKDFMHPNAMGWNTVMLLDNGENIKTQHVELPAGFMARFTVESLGELPGIILNNLFNA